MSDHVTKLTHLLDNSSAFFLPRLRCLDFTLESESMLTSFCETLLLSNNIVELTVTVNVFKTSHVIALTEVFRSIHSFRKINLRSLSLHTGPPINEEQTLLLFTALMSNTSLKSLDVSGLVIEDPYGLLHLLNTSSLKNLVFPSFRTLGFEDFFTLLNIICINKMVIDLHHSSDWCSYGVAIQNGVFRFSSRQRVSFTSKEVSILSLLLKSFIITSLTFENCHFYGTSFTDLCDSLKINRFLTSVDFSRIHITDNDFCDLIEVLSSSSSIRSINLNSSDLHLFQLLTIFKQFYTHCSPPTIQTSPDSIDFDHGTIIYDSKINNIDLILLLDALKSNVPIKRVDCLGLRSPNLEGLFALLEIQSLHKSIIDLNVFPHSFDVSRGTINYA
ncbi:hypothetical protein GEMRC1_001064 [Eukaryota sp. GEM-RC1]